MTDDAPLPGLDDRDEPAAGRSVIECRECHRPLRDRTARLYGLGDGCRHKLGERSVPRTGRFEVEQDGLWEG